MKSNLIIGKLFFCLTLIGFVLSSCQKIDDSEPEIFNNNRLTHDCITFDDGSFSLGDFVSQAYSDGGVGPVAINGYSAAHGTTVNAAMIFDSNNPTGGDDDLGTPNGVAVPGGPGIGVGGEGGAYANTVALNNILIISEDLDPLDPDDADIANELITFDFSGCGTVTAESINILDVDGESAGAFVTLKDDVGASLGVFPIAESGDNGFQNISFGSVSGVTLIEVLLNGSGAVDNICFTKDTVPTQMGCTHTIGYWKNHAGFGPQPDVVSQYLPITLGTNGGTKSLTVISAQMAVNVLKQKTYGQANNGITKLYAQLLASKLSIASGSDASPVALDITAADALLSMYDYNDWKSLSKSMKNDILDLKDRFDDYNNGRLGVLHCD